MLRSVVDVSPRHLQQAGPRGGAQVHFQVICQRFAFVPFGRVKGVALHVAAPGVIVVPALHAGVTQPPAWSSWSRSHAAFLAVSQSVAPATGTFLFVPHVVTPAFSSIATDQLCPAAGTAMAAATITVTANIRCS